MKENITQYDTERFKIRKNLFLLARVCVFTLEDRDFQQLSIKCVLKCALKYCYLASPLLEYIDKQQNPSERNSLLAIVTCCTYFKILTLNFSFFMAVALYFSYGMVHSVPHLFNNMYQATSMWPALERHQGTRDVLPSPTGLWPHRIMIRIW